MKTNSTKAVGVRGFTPALLCGALFILVASSFAISPTPNCFVPPGTHTSEYLGYSSNSVAIGGGYMVVGCERGKRPPASVQCGGVHVFNSTTGAFVRSIYPADGVAADDFGGAAAISGNFLAVGAWGREQGAVANAGAVYLFNLSTGALIRRIDPPGTLHANDNWGSSLAMDGDLLVVGSGNCDGPAGTDTGGVFTHRISTNTNSAVITGAAAGDFFGSSVAIWRGIIAVGAPGEGSGDGRVRLYEASSLAAMANVVDALAVGHHGALGTSVAMDAERILVGAPYDSSGGASAGRCLLFRMEDPSTTPTLLSTINGTQINGWFGLAVSCKNRVNAVGEPYTAGLGRVTCFGDSGASLGEMKPGAGLSGGVGYAVALAGDGTVVAASPFLSIAGANSGALWRATPFLADGTSRFTLRGRSGEAAPGAPLATFSSFNEICTSHLTPAAAGTFVATLAGTGAAGGKTKGIWSTIASSAASVPELTMQTAVSRGLGTTPFTSFATVTGITRPIHNDEFQFWFKGSKTAGTSVFSYDGGNGLQEVVTAGAPLPGGAPVPATIYEVRAASDNYAAAIPMKFKTGTGSPAASATSDSGIYFFNGPSLVREGVTPSPLSGAPVFGEVAPRVARAQSGAYVFDAFVQTTPAVSGVFYNINTLVAKSGDLAYKADGSLFTNVRYASFLGETVFGNNVIFRATLTIDAAASVSTANNEGLWISNVLSVTPVTKLIARKGDTITGTSLKWLRFLNYGSDTYGDALILAQVSGTGVTTANDMVLVNLYGGDPANTEVLLREGSAAPGCDGARIGTISLVDMAFNDTTSNTYGVLASLVTEAGGASTSNNLVWLVGDLTYGNAALHSRRMPSPKLRKGERYLDLPGRDTITSIAFPATLNDASGASNTGMAHVVTSNQVTTAVITYNDRSTAIVTKVR